MKKYKFESWYNGDVTLLYSEVFYKENENDDKNNEPVFVTWDNFAKSEVVKIKEKQKEIFDENVNLYLTKFQTEFEKRFKKSLMAAEFLEMEKNECFNILYTEIPNSEIIITSNWKIPFNFNDLLEIQEYANKTILRGIENCLDFIHSPNNKYQIKNKIPPQVYAQTLYEYYNWLNSGFKSDKDKDNVLINIEKINTDSLWFKVGLFFANGQISQLIENYKNITMPNFTAISKELGNINYRPYISESINNTNISDKNIFSNNRKVQAIIKYCEINNIIISEDFKKRVKI